MCEAPDEEAIVKYYDFGNERSVRTAIVCFKGGYPREAAKVEIDSKRVYAFCIEDADYQPLPHIHVVRINDASKH
jgi:hypothetical protein